LARPKNEKSPVETLLNVLSTAEKQYFNRRFKELFGQADSDPVLEPTIRDLIINELFIARYQKQLQEESLKQAPLISTISALHVTIGKLQEGNLKGLESLNLTKAKKDAMNKSPETTPSRIVTGYALAATMMSSAEREKNKKDIEDAMTRLRKNQAALIDQIPSSGDLPSEADFGEEG
jgi:hypothetical protein